ncbi:MAG TPA: oligosaccharide flippase family protein [Opitutaceae bacterium]|nr:oligosaccharide flippase family protein [Opitutaceae bacterium]
MSGRKASPIRGSLLLTGGRLVSSLSGLILVWLIAHRGAGDLGVFRTLFSFFLVAELFPLLGLQIFLMREISLHRDEIKKYLLHSAVFALVVSVAVGFVLLGLSRFGGYSPEVSKGLVIITGTMPATALYVCFVPILVGLEKTASLGVLQALETLGRTMIGAIFVLLKWDILTVITVLVAVRWLVLIAYWLCIRRDAANGLWRFERNFFKSIIAQVPVFAGITVFVAISRFAAPLMLPWMQGDRAAGQFGASYVIVDIALLLPTAIVANLMPRLSLLAKDSVTLLSRAAQDGIKMMAMGTLPVAGLVTLLAKPLLAVIFRNPDVYVAAAPLLQINIWLCVFMAFDQVLSSAIVACGKQRYDLQTVAIGAIATLGMLFGGISTMGVRGAAIGLAGGCLLQLSARFVLFAPHLCGINPLPLVWRPVVATGIMMVSVFWIPLAYWPLAAVVGLVVYISAMKLLGALSEEEWNGINMLLRARKT